jgi:hypothetical protein
MRTDFISNLNDHLRASAKHMREALALKQAEVARLESLIRVTENMASEEQMPGDPTVNGDREPLPSVVRPAEAAVEMRNGRPVISGPAETASTSQAA